ncbi:MAG: dihydropteroate synthase [Actinomycetota bacterium]|nr:dihydropteroate synthase [Actinomycetota bacterium]
MILRHATGELALDRCLVMGIVNRTPDSFYDGGRMELSAAVDHALRLVDEGADLLDLGAVKAGPGPDVSVKEETARLLPLVEAVAARVEVPLSVETGRAAIATAAFEAGASMLNDVTGAVDEDVLGACAEAGAAVVLMHHGGQIRSRPRNPRYDDVVRAVTAGWRDLTDRALRNGSPRDRIVVDPGLDFGKNTFHSLELLDRLPELVAVGWPVLVAASRKDVVGETLGVAPGARLQGSLAVVAVAVRAAVAMVRVHDVAATVQVVRMVEAIARRRPPVAPVRGLWE